MNLPAPSAVDPFTSTCPSCESTHGYARSGIQQVRLEREPPSDFVRLFWDYDPGFWEQFCLVGRHRGGLAPVGPFCGDPYALVPEARRRLGLFYGPSSNLKESFLVRQFGVLCI